MTIPKLAPCGTGVNQGTVLVDSTGHLIDNSLANTNDSDYAATTAEELRLEIATDTFNQIEYGTMEFINSPAHTKGIFNFANFAQQGLATDKIGFILHHYTDSRMAQLDNVGDATILTLKNAKNAGRRPDKAANYAGVGNYIDCVRVNGDTDAIESIFSIIEDGRFLFAGAGGTARFIQNKTDDGFYAFAYECSTGKEHPNLIRFLNGANQVFAINNDVGLTRAVMSSASSQTSGMMIETKSGDLLLNPATKIRVTKPLELDDVTTLPAVTPRGTMLYNGVPVYGFSGNWLYFSDNSIAV